MKRLAALLLGIVTYASAASAGPGDACGVAAHLVQADAALPHVAAAIKNKILTIVVSGTTSSTLPGANGLAAAYPMRLEAALQKKLQGVNVKVISLAKPRQTAAEMAAAFPKVLRDEKPALVVWQTGTADALRGIGTDNFQAVLESAIARLHEGGADVIFMNPQYSPRTDAVIATATYAETIRWVALSNALNLFDRQAIMRQWDELGTFDLLAATKSLDTAAKVHDCIGRLVADLVLQGVASVGDENREKTSQ
jgi:lysophospholipase L1-like esterase